MSKLEEEEEKPELRIAPSSGGFSGFVLDPAKCSQLSLGERRELVCQIAQWSKDAPEILSAFTRRELREIICAEMGIERKYTGSSKLQMIQHLLRLISKKYKGRDADNIIAFSSAKTQTGVKRKRKMEPQPQLSTDVNPLSIENTGEEHVKVQTCENAACRATLFPGDAFCKRCSCCICHYFDDNKDPSLWLTCGSDSLSESSCGLTCHLICALKDDRTGIMKIGRHRQLDGSFYCVSCGKVTGLMRNWRKQLMIAKEARRVDVLCLRVLLGYRMLTGTGQYKEMQKILETALQLLKNELGPLDLVCSKMARGIVNRLSCGTEVQKLCASAIEAFDSMLTDNYYDHGEKKEPASCQIPFEGSSPRLQLGKDKKNKNDGLSLGSFSPPTPSKSSGMQEESGLYYKKQTEESAYEYSVRVVKWLEHEGHIDEDFRVKFLTWFSLKATMHERRVVNVFVDALIDDPTSLSEQLVDTFKDKICCEQKPAPWHGVCTKPWH